MAITNGVTCEGCYLYAGAQFGMYMYASVRFMTIQFQVTVSGGAGYNIDLQLTDTTLNYPLSGSGLEVGLIGAASSHSYGLLSGPYINEISLLSGDSLSPIDI